MRDEETPEVVVVTPEIVPEEPDNLAYHVGELRASHESLRRDMAAHAEEVASLKALHQTLLDELQRVEEVAEEIAEEDTSTEDAVAESASVADPVHAPEGKRRHWLLKGLTGH
jgi:chromosome segregation ATPase